MEPVDNADTAAMALRVWQFRQGLMVSVMLNLGERLGLFAAMANRDTITSSDVADWCGYDERWCREWLRSVMAAADIIESADGETFRLDGAAAAVLVSGSDHLLAASGALAPLPSGVVDSIAAAFATGAGVPYDAHGSAGAHQIDAMLAPWARHGIIAELLPRIGDLVGTARCRLSRRRCGMRSGSPAVRVGGTVPELVLRRMRSLSLRSRPGTQTARRLGASRTSRFTPGPQKNSSGRSTW